MTTPQFLFSNAKGNHRCLFPARMTCSGGEEIELLLLNKLLIVFIAWLLRWLCCDTTSEELTSENCTNENSFVSLCWFINTVNSDKHFGLPARVKCSTSRSVVDTRKVGQQARALIGSPLPPKKVRQMSPNIYRTFYVLSRWSLFSVLFIALTLAEYSAALATEKSWICHCGWRFSGGGTILKKQECSQDLVGVGIMRQLFVIGARKKHHKTTF